MPGTYDRLVFGDSPFGFPAEPGPVIAGGAGALNPAPPGDTWAKWWNRNYAGSWVDAAWTWATTPIGQAPTNPIGDNFKQSADELYTPVVNAAKDAGAGVLGIGKKIVTYAAWAAVAGFLVWWFWPDIMGKVPGKRARGEAAA